MTHLLILVLLAADPVPADAPVQAPRTLVYPDGGRCENAAAAKAEDKALLEAEAAHVKPVLLAGAIGLAVGLVVGVVLASSKTPPKP